MSHDWSISPTLNYQKCLIQVQKLKFIKNSRLVVESMFKCPIMFMDEGSLHYKMMILYPEYRFIEDLCP